MQDVHMFIVTCKQTKVLIKFTPASIGTAFPWGTWSSHLTASFHDSHLLNVVQTIFEQLQY